MPNEPISEIELSHFAALCEALLLIDEKEAELGMDAMPTARGCSGSRVYKQMQGDIAVALQQFVAQRGKEIHLAFLTSQRRPMNERRPAPIQSYSTVPKVEKGRCLVPQCTNLARSRGLCPSCSASARKLIKQGKTTWEELVKKGKALEIKAGVRGASFRDAFFLS